MIILRRASVDDAEFLFNLRNEEPVRLASFTSDCIDFTSHSKWFEEKIVSEYSVIFIAEINVVSVGQVRFDVLDEKNAEVSIAVSQDFCGKGYGTTILKESSSLFFDNFKNIKSIYALIKINNIVSRKSFSKAGYCCDKITTKYDSVCVQMVLHKK